ncbi:MAG: hypothetical protein KAV87_40050, partial [Desulfobacteraceae bacterium]|nr:hypothetical protein [Desulfobacteraceae bacterium]
KDNIIKGNPSGIVVFLKEGARRGNLLIRRNTFWNNETDTENCEKAPLSISEEPAFRDPANGDFSLTGGKVMEQKQGLTDPKVFKALWKRWKNRADKTDVQVEGEEGWGEAVEGIDFYMWVEKLIWEPAELPLFKADLVHKGKVNLVRSGSYEVEVDNSWYVQSAEGRRERWRVFQPQHTYRDISFKLDNRWLSKESGISLKLSGGRHRMRLAFNAELQEKDGSKSVRLVTEGVEFHILETGEVTTKDLWFDIAAGGRPGAKYSAKDVVDYHKAHTGEELPYDELSKIYTDIALTKAQLPIGPYERAEIAERALALEDDELVRLQLYTLLGGAYSGQAHKHGGALWGRQRRLAAEVYFLGLSDVLRHELPAKRPELPAVGAYTIIGPVETVEKFKKKHEQEVKARKEAERISKLVRYRQTLTKQLVRMYAGKPDASEELRQLTITHIGSEVAAEKMVDAVKEYPNRSRSPFPVLKPRLKDSSGKTSDESDDLRRYRESKFRNRVLKADKVQKDVICEEVIEQLSNEHNSKEKRRLMVRLAMFERNKRAAEVLVRIVRNDKNRSDRKLAAHFLGKVGSEEDIDDLFEVIKGDKGAIPHGRDLANTAYFSIGEIGGDKAAIILLKLWDDKELVSDFSLFNMGFTGSPLVLDLLQEVLERKEDRFRLSAAGGLSALASRNKDNKEMAERVRELLRVYVEDHNPKVRGASVDGFYFIGQSEDLTLMNSLINDPYSEVVSYTENGEVKEKTVYPIREKAQLAIAEINRRIAKTKKNVFQPIKKPDVQVEGKDGWGEVVDGLRVGMSMKKTSFAMDEPIQVQWRIKNVSQEDKTIIWHKLHYSPVVFDIGKSGEKKYIREDSRRMFNGAGPPDKIILKPGETKEATFDLRRFSLDSSAERGVYEVTGLYSPQKASRLADYWLKRPEFKDC